ncbi:MAG: hypothetical protein AAF824_09095 [Bacteroidota bacterium]
MARKKSRENFYDRIIKENLEAILLPLSEKLLGISIDNVKPLTEKLQTTLEREPDFIRLVQTTQNEKFILHLEFQTTDELQMVYRMAEYRAILQRKYRIPVRQFVIYLGRTKPKMRTDLLEKEKISGFVLVDIADIPYQELIHSNVPEAIILSVLANFQEKDPANIIQQILVELKKQDIETIRLRKYVKQLEVLSRLRKLEQVTIETVRDMPITYDITTDYVYNLGKKEGVVITVKNLLSSKLFTTGALGYNDIAKACGLAEEEVIRIHEAMEKS